MSDEKSHANHASTNVNTHHLHQFDFEPLIAKLVQAHFPGTREWLFDEVRSWLRVGSQRLFWLEGAAGTGKSVVSAKLMRTDGVQEHIVAWHFCRHDNAAGSSVRVIIESWASMLCHHVEGFEVSEVVKNQAFAAINAQDMFELLIATPLAKVGVPKHAPVVFLLDALDELPRDSMASVLELIADVFHSLPSFVRLLVTSRAENEIKIRLQRFQPVELVVNELRNRADVRAYLWHVAREHFRMELSSADLEDSLEMQFGLKAGTLRDQLSGIQHAIQLSRGVYNDVIIPIKHDDAFKRVCEIKDRNLVDLLQSENILEVLYEDAREAHEKMSAVFASEWEEFKRVDEGRTVLIRPRAGKAAEWVDNVIDPGLKSQESALRKIKNEYAGDPRRMKDLVRFTVECDNSQRMLPALVRMQENQTFDVAMLRNKYATPTLLGYCDFNLSLRTKLDSGRSHICEVQVNMAEMIKAKELAHVYYEKVRSEIPAICDRVGIAEEKDRARFEICLLRMLQQSALDVAVEQLEARAGGLFLYATLLARELQLEPGLRDFSKLQSLPNGLSDIYNLNFDRMVGIDKVGWAKYRRVVSMIISTREPLPESIVQQILGAEFEGLAGPLSVLFPCREGRFEVMHKSVADWLRRADHIYSLTDLDLETSHKDLAPILLRLSCEYSDSHLLDMDYGSVSQELLFALRQTVYHLCSAGMFQEVHKLVTNFGWLLARVATGKPAVLMLDVDSVNKISSTPLTKLVGSALRLGLATVSEDWRSLAGQLVGRLLGHIAKDEVWELLQQVCRWRGPAEGWWCFIQPTMLPAGGNQISSFLHQAAVRCAKWSSDGKLICAASADKKMKIWSTENGECLTTLIGHTARVLSVAWNGDSSKICSSSSDRTVRVWSVENGQCLQTLTGHTSGVNAVAWNGNSTKICSGGDDRKVRLWSAESGQCLQTLIGHTSRVLAVAWNGDSTQICSGSNDNTVRVWSVENGQCMQTLAGHTSNVNSVEWNNDSRQICSGSSDATVKVWSAETGQCLHTLIGHTYTVYSAAWNADSSKICSGSDDATVKIWSSVSGQCLQTLTGHTSSVCSAAWNVDGSKICSGSDDKTVRVWSTATREQLQTVIGHTSHVTAVAWNDDSSQICSGSNDNTIRVWSTTRGQCRHTLTGHTSRVLSVVWNRDKICSGSEDATVKVWSSENGKCLQTLTGHTSGVNAVAWNVDSSQICSGGDDSKVRLWSAESGQCLQTLTGHTSSVIAVAWNNDSSKICSSSNDATIKIWSLKTGQCLHTLIGHTSNVNSVAWNADSTKVCSGSDDTTVKVWSAETGQCLQMLMGHTSSVKAVAWSSDSSQICSGSDDKTVRVWSAESGQCLITSHTSSSLSLKFWQLLGQSRVSNPVLCDTESQLMRSSSNHRRAFALISTDTATMHLLHVLGGSESSDEDLEFLTESRARAYDQKVQS